MIHIQQHLNDLRPYTLQLNRLSLCLSVAVGIGYQCLAMPNANGFVLGVLTSLANAWMMWVINDRTLQSRTTATRTLAPFRQTCFLSISALACRSNAHGHNCCHYRNLGWVIIFRYTSM